MGMMQCLVKAMKKKVQINGLDDFAKHLDKPLFTSYPIEITTEKMQQYCLSVNNQEWVHWDEAGSRKSGLEGLITPGLFIPSLYPQVFWDHIEMPNVPHILVKKIEHIQIYRPIYMGTRIDLTSTITSVKPRRKGIEVDYDVSFDDVETRDHLADARFILRYW